MGTFEKTFEVDGERFELYAQGDDYQLYDEESLPVGGPFDYLPDAATVAALVRATREGEAA